MLRIDRNRGLQAIVGGQDPRQDGVAGVEIRHLAGEPLTGEARGIDGDDDVRVRRDRILLRHRRERTGPLQEIFSFPPSRVPETGTVKLEKAVESARAAGTAKRRAARRERNSRLFMAALGFVERGLFVMVWPGS